jgi:vacuolar iron transporter family protein
MARDAVDAQLESEHGILEVMSRAPPVRGGIGSGIAYLLGAAIPLIVTVAVPVAVESWLILGAVFVSLIVTSANGARTGHTNLSRTIVRTLTVAPSFAQSPTQEPRECD